MKTKKWWNKIWWQYEIKKRGGLRKKKKKWRSKISEVVKRVMSCDLVLLRKYINRKKVMVDNFKIINHNHELKMKKEIW